MSSWGWCMGGEKKEDKLSACRREASTTWSPSGQKLMVDAQINLSVSLTPHTISLPFFCPPQVCTAVLPVRHSERPSGFLSNGSKLVLIRSRNAIHHQQRVHEVQPNKRTACNLVRKEGRVIAIFGTFYVISKILNEIFIVPSRKPLRF